MRKFIILIGLLFITCSSTMAAKIPDDVENYINKTVPGTDIRFDGVVILPDNTVYLPLFPSLFSDVTTLKVKTSYPANKNLNQKPDVIIFNNDFVLMKVLTNSNGQKTVLHLQDPPLQVRTGLLPQDMLVPSGLSIPENLKGIIGNLKVDTKNEDVIAQTTKESFEEFLSDNEKVSNQYQIPQLKDKIMYVTTNYSKNIQVVIPANASPTYSLAQQSIPINIEDSTNGKFLLVTSYDRPFLDVISVADSRFIKQLNLATFPDEIIIDRNKNKAYVTAPKSSIIFVVDLKTMSIVQKIRINGYCEKLLIAENKIFYVDKLKNDIWAIEIDNNYALKNVGKFPNISALTFANGKLYASSRTKSRIAVIDYSTMSLATEFTTVNKPVAMQLFGNTLYILGAQNNVIQKINTMNDSVVENISLNTGGFSSTFNKITDTNLSVITDIKKNCYTIFDLSTGKILKTYELNVPIKDIKITNRIKLFE